VLFKEESTSASPEKKLIQAKQQGKAPKRMNTWSGNDNFEDKPQAWNPVTLMSPSSG
jgi:hypothetical protein